MLTLDRIAALHGHADHAARLEAQHAAHRALVADGIATLLALDQALADARIALAVLEARARHGRPYYAPFTEARDAVLEAQSLVDGALDWFAPLGRPAQ